MRRRIDNGKVAAILASDVCAGAIRKKCNRPRPSACLDCCDDALLTGIDCEYFAFFFAGDIDFAILRIDPNAFWFIRDFYFSTRLPGAEIDNGSARIVFIRNKRESSILADRELLRVRPDMPAIN